MLKMVNVCGYIMNQGGYIHLLDDTIYKTGWGGDTKVTKAAARNFII